MYSFVKNRKFAYILAGILFIFSIISPFILPFHQGIDLTGGVQVKYNVTNIDTEKVISETREKFIAEAKNTLSREEQAILTDFLVYRITGSDDFMIEIGVDEAMTTGDTATKTAFVNATKEKFFHNLQELYNSVSDGKITQSQYVNIGASFGEYIKNSGYISLTLVVIMISIYIMYAFSGAIPGMASWPFAVVTGISLLHDVVVAFGLYVLTSAIFPAFKIDIFLITAMLTVLGYSINDTIVIMDRVRATLKEEKKKNLPTIIDEAIHGTMRRSLFTSLTILIVLLAMFIFGPESIKGFVLAMIFGTVVGTWSSIFLAAPALVDLTDFDPNKKIPKKPRRDEDGIIL